MVHVDRSLEAESRQGTHLHSGPPYRHSDHVVGCACERSGSMGCACAVRFVIG